jgi:hypothetical protein
MFENGSMILGFDCHLHTVQDKEFKYEGEQSSFVSEYVDKLCQENISVGVITNHNKFVCDEYKTIKRAAQKKDIIILPGVELSIKEGASSIHVLIVFNPDEWLKDGTDFISRVIDSLFLDVSNPGDENKCTKDDFLNVIKKFNDQNKDYFMICAHVEQNKGFWKECKGTLITDLSANPCFKRRVIGFQKARTRDLITKVHNWMKYDIAFVEGSDPKSINEIGTCNKKTYIKIGENSYSAVKYALSDYRNRVYDNISPISHGYIKKMKCIGGKLSNQVFSPSPELNTLIGIRGSGKSSVLEVLRYALNKEPATDVKYKNDLVKAVLGSGGQVELTIIDKHGKSYLLKRIFNEKSTIYDDSGDVLKIPVETILKNPLYFGQKDLALTRKGYEFDLLNKIIGDKVPDITEEYKNIQSNLCDDINDLRLLTDIPSKISDINNENLTLEHKLQVYKEKGLDEKLKKQTSCNTDLVKLEAISDWIKEMVSSINTAYLKQERNLLALDGYSSQYNAEIFQDVEKYIGQTNVCLDSIKTDINILKEVQEGLILTKKKLIEKIDSLKDEFAEIKREINDEQLDADSYVSYQKKLSTNKEKITTLQEKLKSKEKLKGSIQNAFNQRNAFLEKNYIEYKTKIASSN